MVHEPYRREQNREANRRVCGVRTKGSPVVIRWIFGKQDELLRDVHQPGPSRPSFVSKIESTATSETHERRHLGIVDNNRP